MSEMIERVALAIRRRRIDLVGNTPAPMDMIDLDPYDMALARAAIEAMREPTEVMTNEWPHAHAHLIEGHWRRAFDAALSEKP